MQPYGYTKEQFLELVDKMKAKIPNLTLSTDIIVGFPGETDEEFNRTYNFLEKIKFMKMHVFKYSPRNGTKAAVMENQIDGNIKEERSNKLIELSDKNETEFLSQYIGKNVDVLFEQTVADYTEGHTKNYMLVKIPKCETIEGTLKNVEITGIDNLSLIAK